MCFICETLAKVSEWNSFRVNQNYSDSFQYLYPSQYQSFRTNPKNFLYLVCSKTVKNQSDLIQFIPRHQSEPIWNQVFNPDQSESTRSRIDPIRISNQNQSESFRLWIHSDWFSLKIRIGSIRAQIDSDWLRLKTWFQIGSLWCLGVNRIKSDWFLTLFQQTKYKKFFRLVWNDSYWLGYKYRNESE